MVFSHKGIAAYSRDEQGLISALISSSSNPLAEFHKAYFESSTHRRGIYARAVIRSPVRPPEASDYPGAGLLALCGLTVQDRSRTHLLELVAADGMPQFFSRLPCPQGRALGEFRLYAPTASPVMPIAAQEIVLRFGITPSAGALSASTGATEANLDDYEWRTGSSIDAELAGLATAHARLETSEGRDSVWTISPEPFENPDRAFLIISSAGNGLHLLTVDQSFSEVGYVYDHLGETVNLGHRFHSAYAYLADQANLSDD